MRMCGMFGVHGTRAHIGGLIKQHGVRTARLVDAVRAYLSDPDQAARAGEAGRRYAETHFDLDRVADRFEAVIKSALAHKVMS